MNFQTLVLPGSVLTAGAIAFALIRYTLAGYRAARAEFVPRSECVARHSPVDSALEAQEGFVTREECERLHREQKKQGERDSESIRTALAERRESTHALRNELQKVVTDLAVMKAEMLWLVQAVRADMAHRGVNGIPPAPGRED